MTEHRADAGPPPGPDPYWQHDVAIEVPPFYDLTGGFGFRFKIREAMERYGRSHEDLVQLAGPGTRSYFHGKPYQLIADHHLTVDLFAVPRPTGEVGTVQSSSWEGFKHQELGNAQGWYDPENRTLVLWECFLEERYRGGPPWENTLNLIIWQAWERLLIDHSPGADTLVTTWEDSYDRETWQLFLEGQGCRRRRSRRTCPIDEPRHPVPGRVELFGRRGSTSRRSFPESCLRRCEIIVRV